MTDVAKPPRRPFVPLAIVAVGLAGYFGYRAWSARQPLEIGGTVEVRTIQVASRAGGRVSAVVAREGDRVRTGQPLVVLDRSELEAQRAEAHAAVELAQAQLDRSVNGPRAVEIAAYRARMQTAQAQLAETSRGARREDIEHARAQLAASESQLRMAQQTLDRDRGLITSRSITQADYDNAGSQVQTAVANRDAAHSALDVLTHGSRPEDVAQQRARLAEAAAQLENAQLGSRDEDVRAARAQLAQAQARLDLADVNLTESTIVAPRDCVVEALDLRPGDILAANQPAATLVEDDQLFVRAYVPETELGLVHVGDAVQFTVDTFGSHAFRATVQHVNEVGEYNPRNVQTADERADQVFLVRLGISEGRDMLRAGMAASVRLPRRHP